MSGVSVLRHITKAFREDERGVTAVEFVIILPVMLVFFAAIVEGSRIYWNYQSAVTGVRDAARLIARTTNSDICDTGSSGDAIGGTTASTVINATMTTDGGQTLFPSAVSIVGTPTSVLDCVDTSSGALAQALRNDETPVAVVTAQVRIELPFGTLFEFFGARNNTFMQSTIVDQSRIYGL